ncbi:TPA: hypothetical protein R4200_004519 [Enterobacter hormaechei subsp. oharae]|uniref:Uncharacterized protein n=1 Tax=Citrobacter freundii TaxID=546 RepID=A0ABY7LA51_CITFR|nr:MULTISPECIES: hypothetical protein [Gammaproteobacteria]AVE75116.1 hypothetical protein AM439_23120 [Enterobacter cloacae complex sp.]ELW9536649.1 hypothetical protein [Enterobacter roggenkampii]HCJ7637744.1 hypothetical protein [Enterobacter hormaechei subsp. xiangfangensis]HED3824033.1 hypothetical protein [Enterobacter hormaechei subsp. oharae]EIJ9084996.1 hypothetical protein [Citrobacter freundii]
MKNHILSISGVYGIIRDHYVSNFPHKLQFQAVDALNGYIKRYNENAFLSKTDNGKYIFENPKPTPKDDSPFENPAKNLEFYLSQESGLQNLFQDTNAMHEWLLQSGFINAGIATEKMLLTHKL